MKAYVLAYDHFKGLCSVLFKLEGLYPSTATTDVMYILKHEGSN